MKAPLFFPDSEYLADKWWHRLAIVIFWSWLLLATGVALALLAEIYESQITIDYDWHEIGQVMYVLLLYAASLFLPTIVYRVMLFIGAGSAWKATKGA